MNKLTILLAVVLMSTTSFAQDEGTDVTNDTKSRIDNVFYFRVGYSNPSWKQFGFPDDISDEFGKSGVMFELGKIYMLNKIQLPDNMAIGIDVDFLSVYWHQFSSNDNSVDLGTLRLDSKVGPSFTVMPADKLAFDVYVKADISWITATAIVYDDDDSDGYGNIGTVGLSTGFNVRYGKLMLGFEYNTVSPKLEDVDNEGEYLGNLTDHSDKSPLPSVSFSIGMAF